MYETLKLFYAEINLSSSMSLNFEACQNLIVVILLGKGK